MKLVEPRKNRLGRVARAATAGSIWLLVIITVGCAVTFGYARHQGLSALSVQTGSMRPVIRPGDAVLVRQGSALQRGDIISFRSLQNSRLIITHRIIDIDTVRGQIITKGDSLTAADSPIGSDRVIGRVERALPAVGYGLDLLRRPVGLAVAVYLPAIILITGEMQRLGRSYDSRRYRLHTYFWNQRDASVSAKSYS